MKTLLFILFFYPAHSQELGISTGAITALTDVGGNRGIGRTFLKDFEPKQVHPCFSIALTKTVNNWSYGIQYTYGILSGSDNIKDYGGAEHDRIKRENSFRTDLHELTLVGKRYFGMPFVSVGAGVFHSDGLNIEPVITYGAGLTYKLSEGLSIESSCTIRKLFTDFLDGVDDRPYSKGYDSYLSLTFGIVLTGLFKIDYLKCPKL